MSLIAKPETAANGTKIAGEGNRDGELITDNSWVMRDLWDTRVTQGRGLVTKPEKLFSVGKENDGNLNEFQSSLAQKRGKRHI